MDQVEFSVQGSAPSPYDVTFRRDVDIISAVCTCPAGQNGQFCKHRAAILANITRGIVSDNADQVSVVVSWLPGTTAAKALEAVAEAELAVECAKAGLIKAKKALARTFGC
jgi:uncharacterized Zn finger protein